MRRARILAAMMVLAGQPCHVAAMGSGPHPNVPFGIPMPVRHGPTAPAGVPWHLSHWLVPIFCLTPFLLLVAAEMISGALKASRR